MRTGTTFDEMWGRGMVQSQGPLPGSSEPPEPGPELEQGPGDRPSGPGRGPSLSDTGGGPDGRQGVQREFHRPA